MLIRRPGLKGIANKSCHPNPAALEGDSLTGKGNVVEVVKVR